MKKPLKISDHITLREATYSQEALKLGISNQPNEFCIENMKLVAENCFEPLRKFHGQPIKITSFFRSPELNSAIPGSSSTSQHLAGAISGLHEAAIDLDCDVFSNGLTNAQAFGWLRKNVEFDQLIWEFGTDGNPDWVHVSFRQDDNRGRCLKSCYDKETKRIRYIVLNFKD